MGGRPGEVLEQVAEAGPASTARSSTTTPLCVRARALDSLVRDAARSARASERGRAASGRSRTMSRSLTLSARRRADPASSTRAAGVELEQRADQELADRERAVEHDPRTRTLRRAGVERREHRLLELAPNPRTERSRSPSTASRSACGESIPSSSKRRAGALWAKAGRSVSATSPAGNRARSLTVAGISPVSSEVADLLLERRADARQLLRAALARERGDRRRGVADHLRRRRYATTRWMTAPSSS